MGKGLHALPLWRRPGRRRAEGEQEGSLLVARHPRPWSLTESHPHSGVDDAEHLHLLSVSLGDNRTWLADS